MFRPSSMKSSIVLCYTHPFNGSFSETTQMSRYQKSKTNLNFTEARGSEWQWNQLSHMQVCTSLQTDNHTSTPPLCFLQAGCPSCRPTNSVNALKAIVLCYNINKLTYLLTYITALLNSHADRQLACVVL